MHCNDQCGVQRLAAEAILASSLAAQRPSDPTECPSAQHIHTESTPNLFASSQPPQVRHSGKHSPEIQPQVHHPPIEGPPMFLNGHPQGTKALNLKLQPHGRASMVDGLTGGPAPPVLRPSKTTGLDGAGGPPRISSHYAAAALFTPRATFRQSARSRRGEEAYAHRRSSAVLPSTARSSIIGTLSATGLAGKGGNDAESWWGGEDDIDRLSWEIEGDSAYGLWLPRRACLSVLVPFIISLAFVAAGVLYLVYGSSQMIKNLQVWRLCFFIACLPVIWWLGDLVTLTSVYLVERSMFRVKNALYYAYAVRRPLSNVLRAVMALGWWALAMTAWSSAQNASVKGAVQVVLKVWACVTIFMCASLLKTLLAKLLSSKFNKASHSQRIQDCLVKEYYLHMLLHPRQRDPGLASTIRMEPDLQPGTAAQGGKNTDAKGPLSNSLARGGLQVIYAGSRSLENALREVKHSIFRNGHPPGPNNTELGTVSEELLAETDGTVAVSDIETCIRPVKDNVSQENNAGIAECVGPTLAPVVRSSAPPGAEPMDRAPPRHVNRASHVGRGTLQHSMATEYANWGRQSGAGDQQRRSASMFSRQHNKLSRLGVGAALVEDAAAEVQRHGRRRGLSAKHLAKMERYVRRYALSVTFRDELNAIECQEEITTEAEAKKLAYYVFWNVKADLERPFIIQDDVSDFLEAEDADAAFAMLDVRSAGHVTLHDCIESIVEIYSTRCDLSLSLNDTQTVIGKLERVIGVVIHMAFIFLYLIVFNVNVIKTYLALSSLVLAFSFVFQNSIRTMYENVMFLFVVHPFDVGDVLVVGEGSAGIFYRVDQIDLNFTTLLAMNGAKTFYPNQKLMSAPFANVSASGNRGDSIKVVIDMDTPAGALEAVRAACEATAAASPGEFCENSLNLTLVDADTPLKMTLSLYFKYTHNGSDVGRTSQARSAMCMALCEALTAAGIMYTNPPMRDLSKPAINSAIIDDTPIGTARANAVDKRL